MKQILHSLVMVFFVFVSCDKSIEYPVSYTSTSIIKKTAKLYLNSGENKNKELIVDFTNRTELFYSGVVDFYQNIGFKATYLNPHTVELSSNNTELVETLKVFEQGGLIYWENQDTLTFNRSITDDRFVFNPLHCYELNFGSTVYTKYLSCLYLIRNGDDLQMPVTVIYQTNPDYPSNYFLGLCNNRFNPNYLSQLSDADTIFIREILINLVIE